MRTAIIIPARLGATRLPNKPLALLGGVPLVVRTARQAGKCREAQEVVVATDDHAVLAAVQGQGLQAVLTRGDHATGTDRVAEAADLLDVELVVNLQGDEPFVEPQDLDDLLRVLARGSEDMATLSAPLDNPDDLHSANVVKVVTRDNGRALYFSRAPIPFDRRGDQDVAGVRRHVGVYAYRHQALRRLQATKPHPLEIREGLEQLRALAIGMEIQVLPGRTRARGIDTPADLAWARARVEKMGEAAFP